MRKAFVITSGLLLTAFALQFVFAAVGAFTKPAAGDGSFRLHSITGMAVIPILTLLTIVFAALARAPGKLIGRRLRWLCGLAVSLGAEAFDEEPDG